ncbi:MAG: FAD-binding protein [Rhodospirillaceae bacterium]|nr:FAD-binding protein [Rhodospirillaceae bacterium]
MEPVDVIVVGSGGAGLLAACVAAEMGCRTLLVSKGQVARSGATATITGDTCVDGHTAVHELGLKADDSDTQDAFFEDTVVAGKFINDRQLVAAMVSEIGPEVKRLREDGLRMSDPVLTPGHRAARGVWFSGMELMQVLRKRALKAEVMVREEFFATDILTTNGVVAALGGLDLRSGAVACIQTRTVVIACGGGMMVYPVQTAPEELTGDGYRLALSAGAELIDMEMVQFLPCVLAEPQIWRGIQFPWLLGPQAGVRAWLLNRYGERFMERWDPERMELSTRDVIAIACMKEVLEGRGGPNGGVYLSWAHLPGNIIDFMQDWSFKTQMRGQWRWEGFDFAGLVEEIKAGRAVEVISGSHFFMGGIAVDENCATRVPGLYACGEAAGGAHGANRLSGNAGSQILVQGRRAGAAAAAHAAATGQEVRRDSWESVSAGLMAPLERDGELRPFEFRERIQEIAQHHVGVVRTGASLAAAMDDVRDLRENGLPQISCRSKERCYNKEWVEAIECESLLDTLAAIVIGADGRTESRGAHYREDFPTEDNGTAPANGFINRCNGALVRTTRPADCRRMAYPSDAA